MRVGVKVIPYNHALRRARLDAGLTQKQLGQASEMVTSTISAIERLTHPVNERQANNIALALGCDVGYLFPPETRNFVSVHSRSVEFVCEVESLDALPMVEMNNLILPSAEECALAIRGVAEREQAIAGALSRLQPRQREIIEMRFGLLDSKPQTRQAIARHFSVSMERIRQIEHKALTHLRHPSISKQLRAVCVNDIEQDKKSDRFGPGSVPSHHTSGHACASRSKRLAPSHRRPGLST